MINPQLKQEAKDLLNRFDESEEYLETWSIELADMLEDVLMDDDEQEDMRDDD